MSSSSASSAASSPSPPGFPPDLVSQFQQHNPENGIIGQQQSGDQSPVPEETDSSEEQKPMHVKLFETIAKLVSIEGSGELTENGEVKADKQQQKSPPEYDNDQSTPDGLQQLLVGQLNQIANN